MSDSRRPQKAIGHRFANSHVCNLAAILTELVHLSLHFAEENQLFLLVLYPKQICLFSKVSRPVLGHMPLSTEWVQGKVFSGIERLGQEAGNFHPYMGKFKNLGSNISTLPHVLMACTGTMLLFTSLQNLWRDMRLFSFWSCCICAKCW